MIYCCKGLDKCCQGMFDACGITLFFIINNIGKCCKCCNECCKSFSDLFDRPFSCWAVFCFFLLGAGAIIAFVFCAKFWGTVFCENNLHVGLLIIGISYIIQNLVNFYIVYKYSNEYGKYGEFQQKRGGKGICEVTWHFLCYDFYMCFYLLFLIFSVVWCSIFIGYGSSSTPVCQG